MKKINPVAKELATNPRLRGKPLADKKKYNRKNQKIINSLKNTDPEEIAAWNNFINSFND